MGKSVRGEIDRSKSNRMMTYEEISEEYNVSISDIKKNRMVYKVGAVPYDFISGKYYFSETFVKKWASEGKNLSSSKRLVLRCEDQIREMRRLKSLGFSAKSIAKELGISETAANKWTNHSNWFWNSGGFK